MSGTIFICPCGRRLKATGKAPATHGRCPSCGLLVRVPDPPPDPPAPAADEDEWNWRGTYELAPERPAPAPEHDEVPRASGAPDPGAGISPQALASTAGDVRPRSPRSEPRRTPSVPYPLRSAEGLGMMGALGAASWVMGTLVPEYCLALMADGVRLGTPSMGRLVALISALPALILIPPTLVYWLQYLARVLVASGEGEDRPPRPPDRNVDGLLAGLGGWLLWLVLGAGVGLLPLAAYWAAASGGVAWNRGAAAGVGLLGLPYALTALLMTFLHDDPLAARPTAVIGGLARLGPSILGPCLTTAAALGIVAGAFAAAFALRSGHFALYILASLGCWLLTAWASMAAMHALGSCYCRRKGRLGWRRERPRWGVG
jgi:hypothetical protein